MKPMHLSIYLMPEWAKLRSKRVDVKPEKANWSLERANLRLEKAELGL